MLHVFSDLEGIRIAIEMERRGEAFYRRAARVSRQRGDRRAAERAGKRTKRTIARSLSACTASESGALSSARTYDDETNAYLFGGGRRTFVFPDGLDGAAQRGL